ncbi:MAG: SPFH domain-containing protein [Propionibacteriaceae bacterium]|jgi:membrane protease subunit (stomatin/prohibitin family)|nr:SPFH domain-containing protein [Propionibacteriaceae bacterium]
MGLIRAALGAVNGTLADQWKEFFYCESLEADVLVAKGHKQIGNRSSNTRGEDNVITNGSGLIVNDGQCMIIVEQGLIVELCAEPGQYSYDSALSPSIFTGDLGTTILAILKDMWTRAGYGGQPGRDQRVYYVNTKEIVGNKYGTQNPVPFRIVDKNIKLDIDISIRANGEFSFRIADPVTFYTRVTGNVGGEYLYSQIESQMKSELLSALQPALAVISGLGIRPNEIPAHAAELTAAMKSALNGQWLQGRGIEIVSMAMNSVILSEEDSKMIADLQRTAVFTDPTMAAANLAQAQADAMRTAAGNDAGAITGFIGMGYAQQAGGANPADLFAMGQRAQAPVPVAPPAPPQVAGWTCQCGAVNSGNFCTTCGKPKPADAAAYRCSKCGWTPQNPAIPPAFCPNCGDPFTAEDRV